MTAIDDSPSQPSGEATGTTRPSDDLEDWLSDIRTEVAADPSGWISDGSSGGEHPAPTEPGPAPAEKPARVGRHRSAD